MPTPTTCSSLLAQILESARARNPDLREQEIARRAGIDPSVLSRMKKQDDCRLLNLERLARVAGLRLCLVPDDDALARIQAGTFLEE